MRIGTGDLQYEVTLGNLKAARRTGNAACSFIARKTFKGNDHKRRELLAISPHTADQEPLVLPDKPGLADNRLRSSSRLRRNERSGRASESSSALPQSTEFTSFLISAADIPDA